ncbi:MAG: site-specific DNA-methyltransferase [Tepidisphaeraceae bacterium]|jgi:Tfp pilus assembly protein PilZ
MSAALTVQLGLPRPTTQQRDLLLRRFAEKFSVNTDLNRQLVSFQANRDVPFYSWFKYKEGFSSALVHYFLDRLASRPGVVLDPFAGAGAALFAARERGWDAVGIEVLPVGCFAIQARLAAEKLDVGAFKRAVKSAKALPLDRKFGGPNPFDLVPITRGAFPEDSANGLLRFVQFCHEELVPGSVRTLMLGAAFSVLEAISFTRKDGQYLRWDCRSSRSRGAKDFHKGDIPEFRDAIFQKLERMTLDLEGGELFGPVRQSKGALDLRCGSSLEVLPTLEDRSIDLVITSPPYCNRYDYTRTYALELVFLGNSREQIGQLRQRMLSCTVENNEKVAHLKCIYSRRGSLPRLEAVDEAFRGQAALHEVLDYLDALKEAGGLNNDNIARMVRNYFYEMAFVIYELGRVLRKGGCVVMVNDNVRYAGEEVPVDLILSDFAQAAGLSTRHIWTLPRGKGNSSQQMGNHGRQEIRKCVYVWEKT